jgi:uncharacterized Zn-binding protein involved in type VI secretion
MYRVKIVNPDGTVAGDSGWNKNVITNVGLSDYIMKKFLSATGSLVPAYFALGSGNTSLATNATSLPGQIAGSHMVALGANTALTTRAAYSDAGTTQFLATFSSNIFAASTTVGCAGLHAATNGSVMCGGTFASSTVATNQAINATYQILFSATVTNN